MKLSLLVGASDPAAEASILRAVSAQRLDGAPTEVHRFARGVLGVAGRPGTAPDALRRRTTSAGDLLAIAGTPIHRGGRVAALLDSLADRLDAGAPSDEVLHALTDLDGHFAAVLWHARERRLAVVTDALGMQPLYVSEAAGTTCYATDLQAIAAAADRTPEFDPAGWGAFFYIGHPIGDRTALAGARRVAAATVRLHEADGTTTTRNYWSWPEAQPLPLDEAVDRIVAELRRDVAAALREEPETTLLFSGGFDSRLILALAVEAGARPRLVCHSHADENADADARFAAGVARLYGLEVERVGASPGFFASEAYLRYLRTSEVAIPSLHLFIAQVSRLIEPEMRAVWDGCLIGPLLKFSGGAATRQAYLAGRVDARRAQFRAAAAPLFRADWLAAADSGFEEAVQQAWDRIGDTPVAPWRFQVESRTRMRTGQNPFQIFASTVPAFAPGLSRASWTAACAVDAEDRRSLRLGYAVFRRHFPEALRVPIASGTSLINPPGAGLGTSARFYEQRARAAVAELVRRPKVARSLQALGIGTGFAWQPSHFPAQAARTHQLPGALVRETARQATGDVSPLFYLEAWRRVMTGTLGEWQAPGRSGAAGG